MEIAPMPIKIEIELDAGSGSGPNWTVRSGNRYEDHLGPDEALWCVVRLMTGTGVGFLQTAEEHAAWEAKYGPKKPLEPWEKQLPPVQQEPQ
jgi:hypothetical protein